MMTQLSKFSSAKRNLLCRDILECFDRKRFITVPACTRIMHFWLKSLHVLHLLNVDYMIQSCSKLIRRPLWPLTIHVRVGKALNCCSCLAAIHLNTVFHWKVEQQQQHRMHRFMCVMRKRWYTLNKDDTSGLDAFPPPHIALINIHLCVSVWRQKTACTASYTLGDRCGCTLMHRREKHREKGGSTSNCSED